MLTVLFSLTLGCATWTQEQPHDPAIPAQEVWRNARNLPEQLPKGPERCFRLKGNVDFIIGDNKISQSSELWLGGPTRLRYAIQFEDAKNLFLLRDSQSAWVQRAYQSTFESFPTAELVAQNSMRWMALRFPRISGEQGGFIGTSSEQPLSTESGTLRTVFGEFEYTANEGLLQTLSAKEIKLDLDDWKAGPQGVLYPHRLTWTLPSMKQVELFSELESRVLYFDRAFEPPINDGESITYAEWHGPQASTMVGEEFGLVQLSKRSWLRGPSTGTWWNAISKSSPLVTWEENRSAVWMVPLDSIPKQLPKGTTLWTSEAGLALRWVTRDSITVEEAAASLKETAQKNNLNPRGAAWVTMGVEDGRAHRLEVILPVERVER
ncbi:MAG: hypothetical protein MK213_09630 [Planctomycetes bacterium]|nr:hypothetical protein [Planctomycetota bacterium]